MWLIYALLCMLLWSGSELFCKIGCVEKEEHFSSWKMGMAVGLVMGLHAMYGIFVKGIPISWGIILQYAPVSALYIGSMLIGYLGLKYIELSISTPICNSSGSVVVLIYLLLGEKPGLGALIGFAFAALGILSLSFVTYSEDDEARIARQQVGSRKYVKSPLAILLPILYCIIDAAGTFWDSWILSRGLIPEDSANTAYELSFALFGLICFIIFVSQKKITFNKKLDLYKLGGAITETGGQFFYVYALAANPVASTPVISAYCAVSLIWAHLFLKEKLSFAHYVSLTIIFTGIILLGIYGE